MNGFTLFKRGQCPICSGASKGCRQSETTGLVFCRDTSANPTGYIYRGEDVWGFGLWQLSSDADAFSEQAREERQRRRQEFLAAEERRRQEQIARQLSAVERHKWYSKLLERLTLTSDDQQKLLSRGFTQEQIINDGYRSVTAWQKVGKGFPPNLPGLLSNGALNVAGDGILCPIRNKDGLIVGCQVRLHDGIDGRYRWLTSATKKNPDGATPHLDGELPLGVFQPERFLGDSIWLTEGIAIKPSLTRYRLGVPVVGASSGRFNGSPETAAEAVEYVATKYQTKTLTFAVDAGDVVNTCGVPERWKQQFDFFTARGYQCRVAWWGQVEKSADDVDELPDTSIIQYLTVDEFWAIVQEQKSESAQAKGERLPSDWALQSWLRSRKFRPHIKLNQEKFRFPKIPDSDVIVAAKSGLGTGKTEALLEQIKASDRGAVILGYRNNLLFQTIDRASQIGLNIYHLREDDGHHLVADDSTHQALCLDSIEHVDGYFRGRDIYLDETCSVLLHAVNGGTLKERQAKAIKILTRALDVCNRAFLLDGNLSDLYVDLIAKLAPSKRVIKIENQRNIKPHTIKFIEGIDIEGEVKKRDKSALFEMLCNDDVIPWIVTDSKELSNIIHKLLKQFGRTGLLMNGDTVAEDFAKKFLASPDSYIAENKPQFFIGSPSIESGVSVTTCGYFTHKFSFFTGVLGTNSQHQMMFRLRDESVPHYVFCPERSMVRDRANPKVYSAKKFQQICDDRILQSALLAAQDSGNSERVLEVIGQAISRQQDDWWELSCKLGSLDNFEMDHLRECLIHALREAGHDVEIVQWQNSDEFKAREKLAREELQAETAQELYAAVEFPSIEEAKQAQKSNPRKEVQRRIQKTYLLDRLPGIQNSPVWGEDFLKDFYIRDREFISKQQRFWLLNNFEVSKRRNENDWFYQATGEDFFSASMKRNSHLTIWGLRELDVLRLLNKPFHKDSPEVLDIIALARTRHDIKSALRAEPEPARVDGKERISFITRLLAMIGLSKRLVGKPLINGVRTKVYEIDAAKMQCPARLEVLAAVERKFTAWFQSEKSEVNWDEPVAAVEPVAVVELKTNQDMIISRDSVGITEEEGIEANAELLRECIADNDFEPIKVLTEEWEQDFKKEVWRRLSQTEQAAIRLLAQVT